jgi:hypothetical protein
MQVMTGLRLEKVSKNGMGQYEIESPALKRELQNSRFVLARVQSNVLDIMMKKVELRCDWCQGTLTPSDHLGMNVYTDIAARLR